MIIPTSMAGKTIAVLGLGRSGIASVKALLAAGAKVFAYDDHNPNHDLPAEAVLTPPEKWPWEALAYLVISPGIPHAFPAPHKAAQMALSHDVPIITDVELLMQAQPRARIVGITGTNGKSTTTMLICHLLNAGGIAAVAGGNIGIPVLDLDDPGDGGAIVLELSSYQLETVPSLKLEAGAIINITPDHLDRHCGWGGYVTAKTRLTEAIIPEGLLVLGSDDALAPLAGRCAARTERIDADTLEDIKNKDIKNPALAGAHNIENAAIALKICAYLGAAWGSLGGDSSQGGASQGDALEGDSLQAGLMSFKGLPHRMEQLGSHGGIQFVNDSKATNAQAAEKALKSFPSIYWIAGGQEKQSGITTLADSLDNVVRAYLIGEAAEHFATDIAPHVPCQLSGTLGEATRQAISDAISEQCENATILLAPAAASFDQFSNFEERGDSFRLLAQQWLAATDHKEALDV